VRDAHEAARVNGEATDVGSASLFRRLAAMLYDGLLLIAILMIATAAFLPFTGGEAVSWDRFPVLWAVHKLVVMALIIGFYGLFWTRQGQTLGMASWRLRVQRNDGSLLDWRDTALRVAIATLSWAPLGLGWWWCLGPRHETWHDRLSRTRVVVLPKRGPPERTVEPGTS
jgi:uncharacterized RDD family membrane protein YckC